MKIASQEHEVMEKVSVLWDIETQDTWRLVLWKLQVVELTSSKEQVVFSFAGLNFYQKAAFPPHPSNGAFLLVQKNVERFPDFQDGRDGEAVITPCTFSNEEPDKFARSILKISDGHGRRVTERSASKIYESPIGTGKHMFVEPAESVHHQTVTTFLI